MSSEKTGRITFWFKDTDNYVSVIGDNFYETESGLLCAYNGNDIVARFDAEIIKGVYITYKGEREDEHSGNKKDKQGDIKASLKDTPH